MAERVVKEDAGVGRMKNDENLERDDASVVYGLNLVLILSSLSSSDEQRGERESGNRNYKAKYSRSRSDFHTRRQQVSRAVEKQQMSKIQMKTRDCRHGRVL